MLPFSKSALGGEAWRLLAPGALEGLSEEVQRSSTEAVAVNPEKDYVVVISNAEGALRFGLIRAISRGHAAFIMGSRHPNFAATYVTVEELEQ